MYRTVRYHAGIDEVRFDIRAQKLELFVGPNPVVGPAVPPPGDLRVFAALGRLDAIPQSAAVELPGAASSGAKISVWATPCLREKSAVLPIRWSMSFSAERYADAATALRPRPREMRRRLMWGMATGWNVSSSRDGTLRSNV